MTKSWTNNWNELATFFKYPKPIQKLIYTTNPIESLNSSIKRRTKSGVLEISCQSDKILSRTDNERRSRF